jgi:hypothetical protein
MSIGKKMDEISNSNYGDVKTPFEEPRKSVQIAKDTKSINSQKNTIIIKKSYLTNIQPRYQNIECKIKQFTSIS